MAPAAAGVIGLQVGPVVAMIVLSMALIISAHAHPGVGRQEEIQRPTLPSRSIRPSQKVEIKLITSPSPNYNSPDREYVKVGRGGRSFRPARRFLEAEGFGFEFRPGSTPPSCDGKCQGCTPCDLEPIVIPHMVSVSSVEYKYEHWACVCKTATYLASTRT